MIYQKRTCWKKLLQRKTFEYSPLGKKLKAQTDIEKKQYQGLNKFQKSDEKKTTLKKYNKSDLTYNNEYSFYKYYRNSKKFDNLFSNQSDLF